MQQNDYIPVNWSPYATNPIDHVDGRPDRRMLVTPKGEEVTIIQSMNGVMFTVHIGDDHLPAGQNETLYYVLNTCEVGFLREGSYREWLAKVYVALGGQKLTVHVEQPYRKFFDENMTPQEVALLVLPARIRVIKTLAGEGVRFD